MVLASNLASLLLLGGKLAEAEPLLRRTWERSCAELGAGHPNTLAVASNLAVVLVAQVRTLAQL